MPQEMLSIGWGLPQAGVGGRLQAVMPDATIQTIGRVLEPRGGVLYRVSMPNGKVILAHLSKPLKEAGAVFEVGDELLLELTPYDFDTARILGRVGPDD